MIDLTLTRYREKRVRRTASNAPRSWSRPFAWYDPAPGTAVVHEALVRRLAR
jgi:hypothetical protein